MNSWIWTALLHLIALPVTLAKVLYDLIRSMGKDMPDQIPCSCGTSTTTARMSRCPSCGAIDGSMVACSFCKEVFETVTCDGCGGTVRIP